MTLKTLNHWTYTEERTLKTAYKSGASYRQILALLPGRSFQAVSSHIRDLNLQRKYELLVKGKRIGHFDIETSQLNASFGFMISWAIKDDEGGILSDSLSKADFKKAGFEDPDKRIVGTMVDALNQFDIITYHFGDYFDGPFARTRALLYGYQFPEYGAMSKIDTWRWSKRNLKLHSNRLDSIAEFFGINSKTHLSPAIWRRASRGDQAAIKYIVEHNRQDVITLGKVYHKLKAYSAGTRSIL